jgi:hypothetical protein
MGKMPVGEKFGTKDPVTVEERLIEAAKEGNIAEVERLVTEEQADIDYWDDTQGSGYTALQWAVQQSKAESVRTLLRLGADPNIQHKSGNIALQWAAHDGKVEIATMLLSAGSDITLENFGGFNSRDSAHHRAYDDPNAPEYMLTGSKQVLRMIDKVIEKQKGGGAGRKRKKKTTTTTTTAMEATSPQPPPPPPQEAPPMRLRKRRGQPDL